MSNRKIPSNYSPAASVSALDLNLEIPLLTGGTPYHAAAAAAAPAKKLRSSSEAAGPPSTMDARVPDRDRPDDDDSDDSASDVINTEEEPFPAASSALVFDIMRKEGRRSPDRSTPTTHQLFPETAPVSELNLPAAPNQWLKLAEAESPPAAPAPPAQPRKSRRGPRSRSSQYRGVTFYRRTGRWESHIWDCGKQVYLGGFDTAHAAARAYDRAAIKFRGVDADINFTLTDYDDDMKATKDLAKEEFVQVLRRQSTGFSRGSSKYRGVNLQKCGQWEARMAQLLANNNGIPMLTNFQPREFDTNTSGREDDLDLRLGISSPNSTPNGKMNSTTTIMEARVPLVDKTTTSVDGPGSSSRVAGPSFGFQPLHRLPINVASNNLPTWPPPPPPSTFDRPETRGGNNGDNIPFLATTTATGGFGTGGWAHHHQLTGGVNSDGVPKWPTSSRQIAAASSGFLSSSNNRPNVHIGESTAGDGSSTSSPNVVNPFQPSNGQYWYAHKRAQ